MDPTCHARWAEDRPVRHFRPRCAASCDQARSSVQFCRCAADLTQPELIILDEPTRGIDIGAKAEIEQLIARLRADGLAVLLISSEIEEIVRNCTRVLVLRERALAAEVPAADLSPARLMRAMAGGSHE